MLRVIFESVRGSWLDPAICVELHYHALMWMSSNMFRTTLPCTDMWNDMWMLSLYWIIGDMATRSTRIVLSRIWLIETFWRPFSRLVVFKRKSRKVLIDVWRLTLHYGKVLIGVWRAGGNQFRCERLPWAHPDHANHLLAGMMVMIVIMIVVAVTVMTMVMMMMLILPTIPCLEWWSCLASYQCLTIFEFRTIILTWD